MNNSIKQHLSSESSVNEIVDKQKQNGKAICSVCLKENYEDENKISELVLNDLNRRSQFSVKKQINLIYSEDENETEISNKQIKDKKKLLKQLGHKTNLISRDASHNILIHPCNCDRLMHTICLLKWCVINITFQCSTCGKYINNLEFEVKPLDINEKICFYLKVIFLSLVTISTLVFSITLFCSLHMFQEVFLYWKDVFGIVTLFIGTFFLYYTIQTILEFFNKRIGIIKFTSKAYNRDIEMKDDDKIRLIKNFTNFYKLRYEKSINELIEDKHNNIIYHHSVTVDTNKLRKYFVKFCLKSYAQRVYNNNIVEIPVDNLSINKALIKKTFTSASQYMAKHNSYHNKNSLFESDRKSILMIRSNSKKSQDNYVMKLRNNKQPGIKIRNKPSNNLDNQSNHSMGDSLNTEQNQLLNYGKKSNDNFLKIKENS